MRSAVFLAILLLQSFSPQRTPDGKPDLQGYWNNGAGSAPWDIEPHPAAFQIPAGDGIIVDTPDKKIPYKPEALAKRNDLRDNHVFDDPQGHCAPSGIPRQTYTPFGFQILQPRGNVVILYEAEHAYRVISTERTQHVPSSIKLWQGDSIGRWDGDTLVVDTTNFNGRTWFDEVGNFTTDSLHVIERYTPINASTIQYEVRIEDPAIYTQPWTARFPLRKNTQKDYYILEFACHEGERDLQHYTEDTGNPEKKGK